MTLEECGVLARYNTTTGIHGMFLVNGGGFAMFHRGGDALVHVDDLVVCACMFRLWCAQLRRLRRGAHCHVCVCVYVCLHVCM